MWNIIKRGYVAIERGIAKGWANVVTKSGKAYRAAAPNAKGGLVTQGTLRAQMATRGIFSFVGVTVAGWLAYIGITWTGKKVDDGTATLGFLTVVASLTAIGVAATLVLRKK